jgi:hypothetical protein
MPRCTYRTCKVCRSLHEVSEWPEACFGHYGEAPAQATYVRADGMDPIVSQLTGKTHDSRSAYYAELKRGNCEIVGDDKAGFGKRPEYTAPNLRRDLKQALERHGL